MVKILRKLLARAKMDETWSISSVQSSKVCCCCLLWLPRWIGWGGHYLPYRTAWSRRSGCRSGTAGSLQNFAAGVMMIVFRPFRAGDSCRSRGTAGVVEAINIFSTTMRTGDNREIIVPTAASITGDYQLFGEETGVSIWFSASATGRYAQSAGDHAAGAGCG